LYKEIEMPEDAKSKLQEQIERMKRIQAEAEKAVPEKPTGQATASTAETKK